MYYPTRLGLVTFIGTIGLFLTLFFLFIRFLPMISIFEMRTLLPEAKVHVPHGHDGHGAGTDGLSHARQHRQTRLYGLMAEFDRRRRIVDAARRRVRRGLHAGSTPTRRSRSRS